MCARAPHTPLLYAFGHASQPTHAAGTRHDGLSYTPGTVRAAKGWCATEKLRTSEGGVEARKGEGGTTCSGSALLRQLVRVAVDGDLCGARTKVQLVHTSSGSRVEILCVHLTFQRREGTQRSP